MPVYEYKCKDCGTVSEYLVGVSSEQPEMICSDCGSEDLNRMISIISVNTGAQPEGCCGGQARGECDGRCCAAM